MKLEKIIGARQIIDSCAAQEGVGVNLAYWMAKFIAKTENEYSFYLKEIQKIIDAYSINNKDGKTIIPAERISDFNAAVNSLNDTDVEDPGIRFGLTELSKELKLSMKQIYPLLDFIDEKK